MTCTLAHSLNPGCNLQLIWQTWDALVIVFALGAVLGLLLVALAEWLIARRRARRNEQQLQMEIRHRRGWKTLKRIGWLPEDLK